MQLLSTVNNANKYEIVTFDKATNNHTDGKVIKSFHKRKVHNEIFLLHFFSEY